jgi:hypothetical protein
MEGKCRRVEAIGCGSFCIKVDLGGDRRKGGTMLSGSLINIFSVFVFIILFVFSFY